MTEIPKEAIEAAWKAYNSANGPGDCMEAALKAAAPFMQAKQHKWVPSRLGHGESMCEYCCITNREAAVLGLMNKCTSAPDVPTSTFNDGIEAAAKEVEKIQLADSYQGSGPLDPFKASIDAIRALRKE